MTLSTNGKLSIYISGAHSVGKTTLLEALQCDEEFSKFGFKSQSEIARQWVKRKGYTQMTLDVSKEVTTSSHRLIKNTLTWELIHHENALTIASIREKLNDPTTLFQLQQELVSLQLNTERKEILDCGGAYHRFLWDRGILDPIIYAKELCGHKKGEELIAIPAVKKELTRLQASKDTLVFILQPHMDLLSYDGVRIETSMNEIHRIHNSMITFASEMRIPHEVITDLNLDRRKEIVKEQVKSKWPWIDRTHLGHERN